MAAPGCSRAAARTVARWRLQTAARRCSGLPPKEPSAAASLWQEPRKGQGGTAATEPRQVRARWGGAGLPMAGRGSVAACAALTPPFSTQARSVPFCSGGAVCSAAVRLSASLPAFSQNRGYACSYWAAESLRLGRPQRSSGATVNPPLTHPHPARAGRAVLPAGGAALRWAVEPPAGCVQRRLCGERLR